MRTAIGLLAAGAVAFGFQGQASGTIAGQVVNQATSTPLQDAIVTLRYLNPSGSDETMVRETNDAGRFSFTGLWGRDWELSAERRGFAAAWYRGTRYAPHGRFSLERNQQVTDIVLKLVAQTVITGKVLDHEGAVEGARVSLLKAGYSNAIREVASATTLDNGEYRIPRVTAGQYVVKAVVPPTERLPSALGVETGYAATFYPQATDAAQAAPVDVADGGSEIRGIDIHMAQTRLYHSAWETPAANR